MSEPLMKYRADVFNSDGLLYDNAWVYLASEVDARLERLTAQLAADDQALIQERATVAAQAREVESLKHQLWEDGEVSKARGQSNIRKDEQIAALQARITALDLECRAKISRGTDTVSTEWVRLRLSEWMR